jgi:hypothetical protein
MLGLLDPAAADPAGHARAATATVTDLEQLAQRYQVLYATADPAALLTPVAAHVRMVTAAVGQLGAVMAQQGEMIVAEVGGEREMFLVLQPVAGKKMGEAQVIVGKTGNDLLFRAEHFDAGAVAGEAETDEAVMNQAGKIGENNFDDLPGREIVGIVDVRQGLVRVANRFFTIIEFKDEKGFIRDEPGEILEKIGKFSRSQHGGQAKSVRRIFQSFEKIAFFEQGAAQSLGIRPGAQAERKVEGTV